MVNPDLLLRGRSNAFPLGTRRSTWGCHVKDGELAADPACNAGIAARIEDAGRACRNPAAFGGSRISFKDQRIASIRIAASLA
jgi:hypothetical protein